MRSGERALRMLWYMIVFLAAFYFLTAVCPVVMFDGDDWINLSNWRLPVPLWGVWNPTKVLPETLMPLCGSVAARVVYPLTGDYVFSVTLVSGAVTALFATAYVAVFGRLLRRRLQVKLWAELALSAIFFLAHFVLFRSTGRACEHMFYTPDATCYYHYLIPDMFNCTLVMWFLTDDPLAGGWDRVRGGGWKRRPVRTILLLAVLYFAMLSNVYASVIPAVYVGCGLLPGLAALAKRKCTLKQYLRENALRLAYLCCWACVLVIELFGGRVRSLWTGEPVLSRLGQTLSYLRGMSGLNRVLLLAAGAIVLGRMILLLRARRQGKTGAAPENSVQLWPLALSGAAVLVYDIVLCAFHGPDYVTRTDILFGAVFFAFLFLGVCAAGIVQEVKWAGAVLPVVLCLAVFDAAFSGRTFRAVYDDIGYETVVQIDNDMIEQVMQAQEDGMAETVLLVPVMEGPENWPLPVYMNGRVDTTLYRHGLLDTPVTTVKVLPTQAKNTQFGLEVP